MSRTRRWSTPRSSTVRVTRSTRIASIWSYRPRTATIDFDTGQRSRPRPSRRRRGHQSARGCRPCSTTRRSSIPIPGGRNVADEEDEEASASSDEEPAARDRGPRPKRARRSPRRAEDEACGRSARSRYNGEELKEGSEALEKALAELKEMASGKDGGFLDERARGELERAIQRLQALVQRGPAEAESREGRRRGAGGRPQPPPRRPGAGRPNPDATEGQPRGQGAAGRDREAEGGSRRAAESLDGGPHAACEGDAGNGRSRTGSRTPWPQPNASSSDVRPGQGRAALAEAGEDDEDHPRPDQDRRFAELEERLEKLQDEVKSLKKDAPERK